jgi:hypothetical protein
VQITSGLDYINRNYTSEDRILLINPPAVEARYQWSRWNQPLDLLKLGNFLKNEFGCEVKLFDFMLPVGGKVPRAAYRPEPTIQVSDYEFSIWRWGVKEQEFTKWFDRLLTDWRPTDIWMTSLTTYWWKGVRDTNIGVKNQYPDAHLVLYGQYPFLEIEHAKRNSLADVLIEDKLDLTNYAADYSLYEQAKPEFCALDVRSRDWHKEALNRFTSGFSDFVFFNDPLTDDSPEHFLNELRLLQDQIAGTAYKRKLKFHGICGLYPRYFTNEVAVEMKRAGFVELHFEHQPDGKTLDLDAYLRAKEAYNKAEFNLDPDQVSGFVNIGLPGEELEAIIKHTLQLFEIFGSVILKPYTPTPGTQHYNDYRDEIETKRIEHLSPHFFPFSKINQISLADYEELYTLAASLNRKVRNKSFSCFPGSLAYKLIKTSIERKVWTLGDEKSVAN